MSGASPPTLLVLRALGLGDLLAAVPALRALDAAFSEHRRVLATTAPMGPLARCVAGFDDIIAVEPLGPLPGGLRPDVAVNLHGRGPQSHQVLLALRPRRLVAFACGDVRGPEWRAGEHEADRWCRMLTEHGIPADPAQIDIVAPPEPAGLPDVRGATLVHPGAAFGARRWPPERWAVVARHEASRGRQVFVTGGPTETDLAGEVVTRAGLPEASNLAGRTDVLGLAALVAQAGRLLSADTGVAHLATALRCPSVVLFGPASPAEWGPPASRPWHIALWRGRRGDPLGEHCDPGLLLIEPADVVAALDQLDAQTCPRRPSPG